MIPQQSYDGSINLIINDKKNPPRLINSRFTVREKNTYERVDRLGENDTNLYYKALIKLRADSKLEFNDTKLKDEYKTYVNKYEK